MKKLTDFIRYYLPREDLEELLASFSEIKHVRKNDIFLRPPQSSGFIAFIEKGLFRVYFCDDAGKEITTWFSFEDMVITDLMSFYTGQKAFFYVQALEDCEVRLISKRRLDELYDKRPDYREFGRKFAEEALVITMQRLLTFYSKGAEEHYLELLSQPELLQRVPLKHLATYIGITDSSLSRIRKNLT